jgi:hypothetical protein
MNASSVWPVRASTAHGRSRGDARITRQTSSGLPSTGVPTRRCPRYSRRELRVGGTARTSRASRLGRSDAHHEPPDAMADSGWQRLRCQLLIQPKQVCHRGVPVGLLRRLALCPQHR